MRYFRYLKIILLSFLGFNCGIALGLMFGIPILLLVDQVFVCLIDASIMSVIVACIAWCLQQPAIFKLIIILVETTGTCWFAYNWLKPINR